MNYTPTARQLAQAADIESTATKSHPYGLVRADYPTIGVVLGWFRTQQGARVRAHQLGLEAFAVGKFERSSQV